MLWSYHAGLMLWSCVCDRQNQLIRSLYLSKKNLNRIEGIDGECMETSLTSTTNANDSFWQIQIWILHRSIIIPATPLLHYRPVLSSAFQIYTNEMVIFMPTIPVSPKLDQEGSSMAITYFRIGVLKAKGSNWKRLDGIPCWVDVWNGNCLWTGQWIMVSFMYITHSTLRKDGEILYPDNWCLRKYK